VIRTNAVNKCLSSIYKGLCSNLCAQILRIYGLAMGHIQRYPRNTCLCKGGPFPHSSLGHTNPTYTTKVNRTQRGSSFSQSSHETFTDGCDVNNKSVGNSDLKYRRGLEKSMGKECWEEEKDCPRCGGDGNRGRGKCHRCGGHGTIIIKHCAVVCTC